MEEETSLDGRTYFAIEWEKMGLFKHYFFLISKHNVMQQKKKKFFPFLNIGDLTVQFVWKKYICDINILKVGGENWLGEDKPIHYQNV